MSRLDAELLIREAAGGQQPKEGDVLTFTRRGLEFRPPTSPSPVGNGGAIHVLATATGLGSLHSVSGLTTGHVLKAISSVLAAFRELQFSELGSSIADGQVPESVVTQHQAALLISALQVVSNQFSDSRISESSVRQHVDDDFLSAKQRADDDFKKARVRSSAERLFLHQQFGA